MGRERPSLVEPSRSMGGDGLGDAPDWYREFLRRSWRRMDVCWLGALVAFLCLVAILFLNGQARGDGLDDACHPADAHSTAVWYVPAGLNTAVILIAYCDGIPPTAWSISFFEGEQPSLWDWWETQNTASELLRGY